MAMEEVRTLEKIGVMGGTFDPIHNGHLLMGECARDQLGLDQILYMPLKRPPHKEEDNVSGESHRAAMVKLAIASNPAFSFSDMELKRSGTTYTADTLQQLKQERKDAAFYFIMGTDSYLSLENWKNPEKIFSLCTVAVVSRNGVTIEEMEKKGNFYKEKYQGSTAFVQMPTIEISSSGIRSHREKGNSIRYLVPEVVLQYIEEHNLYHARQDSGI